MRYKVYVIYETILIEQHTDIIKHNNSNEPILFFQRNLEQITNTNILYNII